MKILRFAVIAFRCWPESFEDILKKRHSERYFFLVIVLTVFLSGAIDSKYSALKFGFQLWQYFKKVTY